MIANQATSHDPVFHGATFDDECLQGIIHDLATEALVAFDLPSTCTITPITISENASVLLTDQATATQWVLRIHRSDYHTKESIMSEISWVEAIAKRTDVQVPHFLHTPSNHSVVTLETHGQRFAVLTDFIDGEHLGEPGEHEEFEAIGSIAGELHQLSRRWSPPNGFQRFSWDLESGLGPDARWGSWRIAPLNPSERRVIERASRRLSEVLAGFIDDPAHWGLIHADMRSANLLSGPRGRTLIDFDDCGYSWYLYDLATTVSFYEHDPEVETWIERWIEGYQQHRLLTSDDRRTLWPLIIYRRLVLLGWSLSHQTTPTVASLGDDFLAQTVELCHRYLLSTV